MNCQSFEKIVIDLAREYMMDANVRTQAVAHGAACEECEKRLSEQQMLNRNLRELSSVYRKAEASDQLGERVLAEFRKHRDSQHNIPAPIRVRYGLYAAVAALALLSIGTAAVWRHFAQRESEQIDIVQNATPPRPVSLVKGPESQSDSPKKLNHKRRARRPTIAKSKDPVNAATSSQTASTNYLQREIVTEFLPIGYTPSLNVQEGGQVVRVEMPRSTMARFGLPVNMDRYDERVKADVWFGADGLARAIRFVQ